MEGRLLCLEKNLLLDFLNESLKEEQGEIRDLTYLKTEQFGDTDIDRKAIFDLYCENERGEKFIVELQKSKQNFFKDRVLYYSTFPIREQAEKPRRSPGFPGCSLKPSCRKTKSRYPI